MTRKRNLGRYLMGLGIGVLLGVGQMLTIGKSVWWWGPALSVGALVLVLLGFEWSQARPDANGKNSVGTANEPPDFK